MKLIAAMLATIGICAGFTAMPSYTDEPTVGIVAAFSGPSV